jgi:hypothetical protein
MKTLLAITAAWMLATSALAQDSATFAERFGEGTTTPDGTIPAPALGASNVPTEAWEPVPLVEAIPLPRPRPAEAPREVVELPPVDVWAAPGTHPPGPYTTPGLPFMSAYGDPTEPPFVPAEPPTASADAKPAQCPQGYTPFGPFCASQGEPPTVVAHDDGK